jgi:UDP-N-acetyl-D-glucosamine dehydrogenase
MLTRPMLRMRASDTPPRKVDAYTKLRQLIDNRKATVAIFGMGPVGLHLACGVAQGSGMQVIGFDTNEERLQALEKGKSYLTDLPSATISKLIKANHLVPTADFSRAHDADVIIIAVQTPLNQYREPDLSHVEGAAHTLLAYARHAQLVILESTTYPGTTRDVLGGILQKHGLNLGEDLFLAFSPDRHDPGNPRYTIANTPKVVGGEGRAALDLACRFYGTFVRDVTPVSSADTAEAVKLTENIFRAVNIGLVNELKVLFGAMGIDIWEVIEAASTKPYGFMPFYPGPGIGGHCIPIDPYYLSWKARSYGLSARFVELAGDVDMSMQHYVIGCLAAALDQRWGRGLKGARVLVIGVAYKKNVNDLRETPATRIMGELKARGVKVSYYDPLVHSLPASDGPEPLPELRSADWSPAKIAKYDAVLIVTDHDEIDYEALAESAQLIVDTRNAMGSRGITSPKIVRA